MNKIIQMFGENTAKQLIEKLRIKEDNNVNSKENALMYIEDNQGVIASFEVNVDSIIKVKNDIKIIQDQIKDNQTPNINDFLQETIIQLGIKIYGEEMTKSKIRNFENDFWFVRLRDLIQNDQAKTRKEFMRLATYWFVLIEYEGYTESEVIEVLSQNKDKMQDILTKWDIKNLSNFIERIHYIASTKQIEYFIKLIKQSSASKEVQDELIQQLLNSDILDTWNNDEEGI